MNTNNNNIEELTAKITRKVRAQLSKHSRTKTKLEATCVGESFNGALDTPYSNSIPIMELGDDYEFLSDREKLIAIKATISTHFKILDGFIDGYGEIVNYKLINQDLYNDPIFFNTNGKLICNEI